MRVRNLFVAAVTAAAVLAVVEQKDATEAQLAIREFNSGIYAFDVMSLREALSKLSSALRKAAPGAGAGVFRPSDA